MRLKPVLFVAVAMAEDGLILQGFNIHSLWASALISFSVGAAARVLYDLTEQA